MSDTRDVALAFYEAAFVRKDPSGAAEKYFGSDGYIQHNPDAPDGAEAFVEAISGLFQAFPDFTTELKRVIVDGDLAAIHHHVRMTSDDSDLGNAVVDIFRVKDGKVVEHWDVVQPVSAEPKNDNTMF